MRISIFLTAFFLNSVAGLSQQVFFVNIQNGSNSNSGKSWAEAVTDLQVAIDLAQYGDEIWVAQGTYYTTGTTDRNISIQLKNGVSLYAGFKGNELQRDERDWVNNSVVISGNIGNLNNRTDNTKTLVVGAGLDSTTVFDGFRMEAAYNTNGYGGGMAITGVDSITNTQPQISHCTFFNNFAWYGAAIAIRWSNTSKINGLSNPTISHCHFERNVSNYKGGAILKQGPTAPGDTLRITNSNWVRNTSRFDDGGGIMFDQTFNSTIHLDQCLFEKDTALTGGGIAWYASAPGNHDSRLIFTNCRFIQNRSLEGASIYYVDFPNDSNAVHIVIDQCLFKQNTTKTASGPALLVYAQGNNANANVEIAISGTDFIENQSYTPDGTLFVQLEDSKLNFQVSHCQFIRNGSYGSNFNTVIFCSMAGSADYKTIARVHVMNSIFERNVGGISVLGSFESDIETNVTNCTFFNNGSYILNKSTHPDYWPVNETPYKNNMTVDNCIIWEPKANDLTVFYNNDPDNLFYVFGYTVRNCAITRPQQGQQIGPVFQNTVFGVYPEFVDTLASNFRLKSCSPLHNQGNNQPVQDAGLLTDLDGNPRIRFGQVDIGAYEIQDSCIGVGASYVPDIQPLRLTPNPSLDGQLTIQIPEPISGQLVITDAVGGIVYLAAHQIESNLNLSFPLLKAGIYQIAFFTEQRIYTARWIKI